MLRRVNHECFSIRFVSMDMLLLAWCLFIHSFISVANTVGSGDLWGIPFVLLMLVAISSSETLLLLLAMNFAHTVLHPLLLFLTTFVQDNLCARHAHVDVGFWNGVSFFIIFLQISLPIYFTKLLATFFNLLSVEISILKFSSLTFNMTDTNSRLYLSWVLLE